MRLKFFGLFLITSLLTVVVGFFYLRHRFEQRYVLVLYHTDHQQLLRVCREFMNHYRDVYQGDSIRIPKEEFGVSELGKQIPPEILALKPAKLMVQAHRDPNHIALAIGMTRGLTPYFGVTAFSEGYPGEHGDRKLMDGLWYSDTSFHEYDDWEDYLLGLAPGDINKAEMFKETPITEWTGRR